VVTLAERDVVERLAEHMFPRYRQAASGLSIDGCERQAREALADITPLLALEVRERLEGLERFGLREDAEHPGLSEVGPVEGGAFLRREQVLAALDKEDSDA
jgi:hypothetical protein